MHAHTFTQDFPITIMHLDINRKASLPALLSMLQEMTLQHADHLGFGYEHGISNNEFWVFTQQQLRLHKIPAWNDTLTISTWVGEISGLSAIREFSLSVDGEVIGESAMQCMLLDMTSHRPKRLRKETTGMLLSQGSLLTDTKPQKIKLPETMQNCGRHKVVTSDLDFNQHVNNTKYAQWMLDALPIELQQHKQVLCYDINFIAETFLGDCVDILSTKLTTEQLTECDNATLEVILSGTRETDNKTLFNAKMTMI